MAISLFVSATVIFADLIWVIKAAASDEVESSDTFSMNSSTSSLTSAAVFSSVPSLVASTASSAMRPQSITFSSVFSLFASRRATFSETPSSRVPDIAFSMLSVADVAASLFSVIVFSLTKVCCITDDSDAAMEPSAIWLLEAVDPESFVIWL